MGGRIRIQNILFRIHIQIMEKVQYLYGFGSATLIPPTNMSGNITNNYHLTWRKNKCFWLIIFYFLCCGSGSQKSHRLIRIQNKNVPDPQHWFKQREGEVENEMSNEKAFKIVKLWNFSRIRIRNYMFWIRIRPPILQRAHILHKISIKRYFQLKIK